VLRRFRLISMIVVLVVMILLVGLFVLVFGRMDKTVEAYGVVSPARHERVMPQIDGIVREVLVDENDSVSPGDTLVLLRNEELELAVERAKRAFDRAQAALSQLREEYENLIRSESFETQSAYANLFQAKRMADIARGKYERAEELFVRNLVSSEERDDRKLEYETTQSYYESLKQRAGMLQRRYVLQIEEREQEVELAAREYDLARGTAERAVITAPAGGVVMTPGAGELVGARVSAGTAIMEIGDLSEMCFIAEVRESDVPFVAIGQEARIFINAFPHRRYKIFDGEVVAVAPRPEVGGTGAVFPVTARLHDPRVELSSSTINLMPGLSGKMKIVVKHKVRLIELLFRLKQ
jgi:multidrug resistance efflux pump